MRVAGSSVLGVQGGASEKNPGTARSGAEVGTSVFSRLVTDGVWFEGSVPMRLSQKHIAVGTVRSRFGLAGNYGLAAVVGVHPIMRCELLKICTVVISQCRR